MNAKHLFVMCLLSISCQIAKSAPTDIEELWPKEINKLLKEVEEKEEEIWKIIEIKKDGQPVGYTISDYLLTALPDQTDKIIKWLHKNPGNVEDESFVIRKCRFKALLQSLEPSPVKHKKRKMNLGLCSTSTQDYLDKPKEIEELLKEAEQKEEEIWKIIEIKEEGQSEGYTTTDNLSKVIPVQKDKIDNWLNENPGSDEGESLKIKKPRFKALLHSFASSPEKDENRPNEIEEIWIEPKEKEELMKIIEQEQEELWKIVETKKEGQSEGYTTKVELIKVLPDYTDTIINWTMRNPGSDEDKPFILKKPRFKTLMQSITFNPEEYAKRISHVCTTSTQILSPLTKPLEIEKLWKVLELKEMVQSKEICLGYTNRSHVVKVLPDYTEKISEWIEKNRKSFKDKPFNIAKHNLTKLIRSLKIDLEELQKLNNRLKENPPSFED
ncbi:uncharacterized protein LOC126843514 isoform X2 [Adelges cooleyi]|uniref:uncharacterized protein LOC126843514 isoform X2 n=1 Tax=Adelges cooleyi TaxID=133065 RepID=UPI00218089EB|nr:uncharacterized protein LOC126843514 isoform X2 [Adelges cooleyi]